MGTGAMELHAMHLKSIGAIVARTLSYQACEFSLIENVGDERVRAVYNRASELWIDLYSQLEDCCADIEWKEIMMGKTNQVKITKNGERNNKLFPYRDLHKDSDSDDDEDDDDDDVKAEQSMLPLNSRSIKSLFWSG